MLGEFQIEEFDRKEMGMVWLFYIFFIITTFLTQIMFMNMLIALMGDTYERVMQQRPTHSLQNKLMLMATMACMIQEENKKNDSKYYLYVIIKRIDDDEDMMETDDENWRGKFYQLTNLIRNKFQTIKDVNEKQDTIQAKIDKNQEQ